LGDLDFLFLPLLFDGVRSAEGRLVDDREAREEGLELKFDFAEMCVFGRIVDDCGGKDEDEVVGERRCVPMGGSWRF